MTGRKENPRQKLIGMMYLVLTALLALNVSKEVLEAFNHITRGIDETVKNTEARNAEALTQFEQQVARSEGDSLTELCWDRAQVAVEKTKALDAFIEKIKQEAVEAEGSQHYKGDEASFLGSGMTVLEEEDNTNIASRLLAENERGSPQYGHKLQEMLNQTHADLVALFQDLPGITPEELNMVESAIGLQVLNDEDHPDLAKRDWAYKTFNEVPLGAALAILTKIQQDVRSAESEVINRMHSAIALDKKTVNALQAMVNPRSTAVAAGEAFEANIFLGAQIGSISPTITVDGEPLPLNGSTGKYRVETKQPGVYSKPVSIQFRNARTGKMETYQTMVEYEVFQTRAIVSPEAMNVLYLGLENPISVSVPGYEPNKVSASLSPADVGTITKVAEGKYVVKITKRNPAGAKVNVTVRTADGDVKSMAPSYFRIKKVPSPYANILNKTGGKITRSALQYAKDLNATLDPAFPYQGVGYTIVQYDFIYQSNTQLHRGTINSSKVQGELKTLFSEAERGDMFIISNIQAKLNGTAQVVNLPGALIFDVE